MPSWSTATKLPILSSPIQEIGLGPRPHRPHRPPMAGAHRCRWTVAVRQSRRLCPPGNCQGAEAQHPGDPGAHRAPRFPSLPCLDTSTRSERSPSAPEAQKPRGIDVSRSTGALIYGFGCAFLCALIALLCFSLCFWQGLIRYSGFSGLRLRRGAPGPELLVTPSVYKIIRHMNTKALLLV